MIFPCTGCPNKHGNSVRLLYRLCYSRNYYVNTTLVVSQLKQLIIKTTSLGNFKMCFTIFAVSKLTEILLINMFRFQFNKFQQNRLNV